jgi:hypothetical protein
MLNRIEIRRLCSSALKTTIIEVMLASIMQCGKGYYPAKKPLHHDQVYQLHVLGRSSLIMSKYVLVVIAP